MSASSATSPGHRPLRVALIGNPNTGKSTLFNALAGMRVRTGNYPGVTVEQKSGRAVWQGQAIELIDLPGTYSLSPRSPDEMVAVDVLTGVGAQPQPDVVVCICNATALERNLFLVSQVHEIGLPLVVCLNMWDTAEKTRLQIDLPRLSQELGVPVVATAALRRTGFAELQQAVLQAAAVHREQNSRGVTTPPVSWLSAPVQQEVTGLTEWLTAAGCPAARRSPFLVTRSLLDPGGSVEQLLVQSTQDTYRQLLTAARERLAEQSHPVPGIEATERYQRIGQILQRVVSEQPRAARTLTDHLDAVLTHRVLGFAICLAVLLLIFSTIYWFSQPLSDGVEAAIGAVSDVVRGSLPPGPLRSLLIDGVLAGVGGVLVFLPQISLLFLFIALLEDCGYMARVAFMMDRIMALAGLSGRSFLPLMSSFACAVPGIMATRVIEDRRDRLVTILIAPLMSCSARLPVYVLMIGLFIPDTRYLGGLLPLRALVLLGISLLGLIVAVPVAFLLRKTILHGEASTFLLELPDYRLPSLKVTAQRVWESASSFVRQAGTLIFATTVIVWALGSFPGSHEQQAALMADIEAAEAQLESPQRDARLEQLSGELNQLNAQLLEQSLLGRMGHWIEPVVRPLGWDWRLGVGVVASFPAREVIVATLGTIFSLGSDVDEADAGLHEALAAATWPDGRPLFNLPVAVSVMVFFALCAQCVSTLVVIRRETNSWQWPVFSFAYMTMLAWCGAFLVYQVGIRL